MEIIFLNNIVYKKDFISKEIIFLFFILIKIRMIYSNSCKESNTTTNTECFNNVIIFDDKKYRAGHHALNKNGDMIIEYSSEASRLFFGIKENGMYYFGDNIPTKVIESINKDGEYDSRYESINLFVSLETDINKENKYLFSTSSFETLTELYDINIDTDNYLVKSSKDFIGNVIFSYQFQLLETIIDNKIIYFLLYIHADNTDHGNYITIKKFGFTSFNLNSYESIDEKTISNNCNTRIISSYIIEEKEIIALFFVKNTDKLAVSFYTFNFTEKGIDQELQRLSNINSGTGIFFKSVYLDNLKGAIIYFPNGDEGNIYFRIYEFYDDIYGEIDILNKKILIDKSISDYNLKPYITLNDLVKINNERVVFISTIDFNILYIFVFDLYLNYTNMKIRVYNYDLSPYTTVKEFSGFVYNNYFGFTSTVQTTSEDNYFSIFMLFGYSNKTDNTDNIINIALSFTDIDNYDTSNNLITKLSEGLTIDNNIFGYIFANKIKLISIPDNIYFYNGEETTLLTDGNIFEFNHRLEQSKTIVKSSGDFYYLKYQLIIKEPDYSTFYENGNTVINLASNTHSDLSTYFEPQTFEGRINTVQFKLCHEYCDTCYTLGSSNDDQQCLTCLPLYQYDYFNEYPSNCVPEGYFNDKEEKKLVQCTSTNSKYYFDTNNKKICFKNIYNCPDEYAYWNTTSNECLNYIIPTTITTISSICNYDNLVNNECSFESHNNSETYNKIKNEIIKSYPENGESIVIEADDNYVFQITTGENEINSLNGNYENKYNLSIIDLGECGKLLKEANGIGEDENLIILKFEKLTGIASEKNVQYEVYDPNTLKPLNLSVCSSTSVDLYIPITLSEETQKLYDDLKANGYDLFNENDSFYTDICTPYESENGTDILLSDRKNDFYDTNETTCQANCQYSAYSSESKYLKCECSVITEEIDTEQPEKLTGETVYKIFYDVLKYSNFGVLKCYKLVFSLDYLKKNIGSILALVYIIIFLIIMVIFTFRGLSPIKIEISNLISQKKEDNKLRSFHSMKNINQNITAKNEIRKIKKKSRFKTTNNIEINNINKNPQRLKLKNKSKKKSIKHKKVSFPVKKKGNQTKGLKNGLRNNFGKNRERSYEKLESQSIMSYKRSNIKVNTEEQKKDIINFQSKKNNIKNTNEQYLVNNINENDKKLSDFELNELEYFEAIKLDKRDFYQMYWALLKREHIILFTFFSWHDYNIIYIKLAKFIFLLCQDMAMNVVFFSDDSMHKLYITYGKYDFIQQIPQIIYSTIISQTIEVFLCYLSLTDKHFYQIKAIKNQQKNKTITFQILRCIKLKLLGFFTFTLILFAFYWYFISAFCAVYHNTQTTFIKDSVTSFLTGLLYPFVLYLFPAVLRIISLKDSIKKRFKCIYKISDIIPIF